MAGTDCVGNYTVLAAGEQPDGPVQCRRTEALADCHLQCLVIVIVIVIRFILSCGYNILDPRNILYILYYTIFVTMFEYLVYKVHDNIFT